MLLAKKVKLKGKTTQKNLGANIAMIVTATIDIKKYIQYLLVDLVVSINYKKFVTKVRG